MRQNSSKRKQKSRNLKSLKSLTVTLKDVGTDGFIKLKKGYRRIYVDGKELLITEENGQAIDDYLTALSRYEDTVAKLKEGV